MLNAADTLRPPHVLVVEDDWEIASFVSAALNKNGFQSTIARDKDATMRQFAKDMPDLVVLDVMLPGEDGFRILNRIRERYEIPVIMLTALSEPDDRVKGLRRGADDYIAKPFHTAELIARIRAVLRRSGSGDKEELRRIYTFGGWTLDTRKRHLQDPDGAMVMLTSGEFDVLRVLCENAGTIMSRDRLVQQSQNRMVEPYDRSVDTLVSRIRRKLQGHESGKQMIKTVRNVGYVFTPLVEDIVE